jgi:hypothetical protein
MNCSQALLSLSTCAGPCFHFQPHLVLLNFAFNFNLRLKLCFQFQLAPLHHGGAVVRVETRVDRARFQHIKLMNMMNCSQALLSLSTCAGPCFHFQPHLVLLARGRERDVLGANTTGC